MMKLIPGFENYAASEDGKIYSLSLRNRNVNRPYDQPMELKQPFSDKRKKYHVVGLSKNGKTYQKFVHSLILETFAGPRPTGYQAAHLDDNGSNNHINNLIWATPSENSRMKKYYYTGNSKNFCNEDVIEIRRRAATGEPVRSIANSYGVGISAIEKIKYGITWRHILPEQIAAQALKEVEDE